MEEKDSYRRVYGYWDRVPGACRAREFPFTRMRYTNHVLKNDIRLFGKAVLLIGIMAGTREFQHCANLLTLVSDDSHSFKVRDM